MAVKVQNCAFFDENGGHFENNADIKKQKKTPPCIFF